MNPRQLTEIIRQAIHHVEGAGARWRATAATDEGILERVAREWGEGGGHCSPARDGFPGFMTAYKGGQRPQIEIKLRGEVFLYRGRPLAAIIRLALGLPDPADKVTFTPDASDCLAEMLLKL